MKRLLLIAVAVSWILVGCANSDVLRGDVYTSDQAKMAKVITYGTIMHISEVQIQKPTTGLGGLSGAAIGGIAGSSIGGGRGSVLAAAIGAVGGVVAGNAIEQKANSVKSVELTIRRDDGRTFVVVQKADPRFVKGLRVKIVGQDADMNVTPLED